MEFEPSFNKKESSEKETNETKKIEVENLFKALTEFDSSDLSKIEEEEKDIQELRDEIMDKIDSNSYKRQDLENDESERSKEERIKILEESMKLWKQAGLLEAKETILRGVQELNRTSEGTNITVDVLKKERDRLKNS